MARVPSFVGKGVTFLWALKDKASKDQIADTAAALSYFSILALFPFLIGVVSLASLLVDPEVVETLLTDLQAFAPPDVTRLVGNQLHGLISSQNGSILTFSALGAYWAASGGTSALARALNRVCEVVETRPWWKTKGIALISTFVGSIFLLVAAVVAVATPAIAKALGEPLGTLVTWMRLPVAGAMAILAWELLYYFLPNAKRPFRWLSPGSVTAVILWLAASWGFSTYVVNFGKYEVTYGALGAFIVLLAWIWISALAVLLGMEINYLLHPHAHRGGPEDHRPRR